MNNTIVQKVVECVKTNNNITLNKVIIKLIIEL